MRAKRYALVTGAGSGLGEQIVRRLAKESIPSVLVGRNRERLLAVQGTLGGVASFVAPGDVSQKQDVDKIFHDANRWGGAAEIVISCAGEGVFGPVGSFSQQQVERALSANLIGTILVSQRAFTEMKESGGFLVNVLSTAAMVGRPHQGLYCAAKWGARGFTESLKVEAKDTPVKVISVFPGGMRTPFWSETCGLSPDTSGLMDPSEVANVIVDNILNKKTLYIAQLVINRR